MPSGARDDGRFLVGRQTEVDLIQATLDQTAEGSSATLLIVGEAGIGKTALVQHAVATSATELVRLSGSCLPLQLISAPLLPLRTAVRASPAPPAVIAACLAAMDDGNAIFGVEAFLAQLTATAPVVLVVDDLQWADQSTLDVLLYLIAGPPAQRLAVLATVRSEQVVPGQPLTRWLADVLRLPRVSQLDLGVLDRPATEAQLGHLLGRLPHQSLVDDVYRAARGHPYFTRLLVQGLDPASRRLTGSVPANLALAVRQAWNDRSPATRAVTSLLAVSGGPQPAERLLAVAADLEIGPVAPALAEAEAAGLIDVVPPDRYWFHHPLLGQVLEQALTPDQRRRWHGAFARQGEEILAAGAPATTELALALALAHHHEQAGAPAAAYRWALRAWDLAGNRGTAEMLGLMRRAIQLRTALPDAEESLETLWEGVRSVAQTAGAYSDELTATEALLDLLDQTEQPLRVSELLVRQMLAGLMMATRYYSVEDMQRAVRLAATEPGSWQHALAVAELAHAGLWHELVGAEDLADQALTLARAANHPGALSFALTASAMAALQHGQADRASALAGEGVTAAAAAQEWFGAVHATMWESNALPFGFRRASEHSERRREELMALGAPHAVVAALSAGEAQGWLMVGDWPACQDRLRTIFGTNPGPFADLKARLVAAQLAAHQGRVTEAEAHLERVAELIGDQPSYRMMAVDTTRAMVWLVAGRPEDAYRAAITGAAETGTPVDLCEWLVPLAARALADLVHETRYHRGDEAEPLHRLGALRERFPTVIDDPAYTGPQWSRYHAVLQDWYDAESSRARREPDATERWLRVTKASGEEELPWLEAYAGWRAAEALLGRGGEQRTEGTRMIRATYDLAERLGADLLRREIVELARSARVRLEPTESQPPTNPVALPGLTRREQEILEHVVRGSTYAEIAAAFFLSEKTVSSHISNMLRKTGTTSRVELSRLAIRLRQT